MFVYFPIIVPTPKRNATAFPRPKTRPELTTAGSGPDCSGTKIKQFNSDDSDQQPGAFDAPTTRLARSLREEARPSGSWDDARTIMILFYSAMRYMACKLFVREVNDTQVST